MKQVSNMTIKRKLLAVILLITFIFCILVGRLFYVEVLRSYYFQEKALDEWTRDLPIGAKRGEIYDRNGVILASSKTEYTLFVRPNSLKEHDRAINVISSVLNVDKNEIAKKVKKKGVSEVKVKGNINHNDMLKIKAAKIDGIYFGTSNKRVYPYGNFMSQILGFTNVDNIGQTGIEEHYNSYLAGVDGKLLHETDLIGRELPNNKIRFLPSISGNDVYLTLDYNIQSYAEAVVNDAMRKYNAKEASCIIMNIKDGGLYAYAKAPSFDLNNIPRDNLDELFANSKIGMVSSVYEPGSTFKILTSAIALEEKAFDENHRFYCPGYRIVDNKRIKCWRTIGHGSQTFGEGIENSCNCVFMDIATKVGTKKMYEYFRKFGLTQKTGIDIKGETHGLLLKESNVKNVDIARIGFGQAIAITPIELITATSMVMNGGHAVTPHILKEVHTIDDKHIMSEYNNGDRIISESTSLKMREYLERVVSHGGGKNAAVEGYRIGGKTGTAQKYMNGAIASGKYISSFIGFAPMEDPEFAVLIIVDEPEGYQYYGSLVAAPYAHDIFKNIFAYKNIKPTKDVEKVEEISMPDLIGLGATEATKTLKDIGLTFEMNGERGEVKYQFPARGATISKNTVAFIEIG